MSEQETLLPGGKTFDPLAHTLYGRFVGADGLIDHAAWLGACAAKFAVGTCRQCGEALLPAPPEELGGGRIDYEAACPRRHRLNAPGGRVLRRSSRAHERPKSSKGA